MRQPLNHQTLRKLNEERRLTYPLKLLIRTGCNFILATGLIGFQPLLGAAQANGVNYISEIQGTAELRRPGSTFQRAYGSDFLGTDDQVRVAVNSEVVLVCSHGRSVSLYEGTHDVARSCNLNAQQTPEYSVWQRLFWWPSRRQPSRNFNARIPYILSPRNTALLDVSRPTIRWNPLDDAQQYRVLMTEQGGQEVWESEWISGNETIYSGPTLLPETRYRIEVTADNGISSSLDIVGFTLLSDEEAERVETQVSRIESLELDEDSEALGLALLYQGYEHSDDNKHSNELSQSALDVLQSRIDAGTENSQIYLLQGDIYLVIGLPLEARSRYEQSLDIAVAEGELERQADSLEGLATVAQGENQIAEAITCLESALEIYESLGQANQTSALQERIDTLRIFL